MGTIRRFFRDYPALAALLLAAALCLKALVPTGYMPAASSSAMIVALCSGAMPAGSAVTIAIPRQGSHQDHGTTTADHPCAFAPLAAGMTGAELVPVALAALAFVFVAAIVRRPLALRSIAARIRPPSQAPPRFT